MAEDMPDNVPEKEPAADVNEVPAEMPQDPPAVESEEEIAAPASSDDPVTEEPSPEADIGQITRTLEDLNQSIGQMAKSFDKYMYRNEVTDAIRAQFNDRVDDVIRKRVTSTAIQIAQVTEDYIHLIKAQRNAMDRLTPESIINSFDNFVIDFENILETFGVSPYEDPAGVAFTTPRHKIAGTIETDDPEKDKTVAELVSRGYSEGETVLVPQRVKIFKLKKEERRE